jgi:FMN phosphatase YigB (HAD superfamily)
MKYYKKWNFFLKESKLRIFDFDDTLVKTDARVRVTYPNGEEESLTPGEYAVHDIDEKNEYDFSQFEKPNLINPREIEKVTNVLRNVLSAEGDRDVVILTARPQSSQKAILDYLEEIGIDTESIEMVLLGDSDPYAKSGWIENRIVDGANDVLFLDDSGKNVDAVKELEDKYPDIKLDARKVDYAEEIE